MWSNETQYTQWALNPSAYQNISHEEIDWAALAQQWIQMKETNVSQVPPAPPPPSLREGIHNDRKKSIEGGEAPMDVDNNKEDLSNSNASNTEDAASWNTWSNWQQWGWNWSNSNNIIPSNVVQTPAPPPAIAGKPTPPVPAPPVPGPVSNYSYTTSQSSFNSSAGTFDYNHSQNTEEYNQVIPCSYWPGGTSSVEAATPSGTNVAPAPFLRQNRQNDWRRDSRAADRDRIPEKVEEEEDTTSLIDAAKRRQLPAWIREGLEKMEREKQKKLDKERQIKEREEYLQNKKREEEMALNELKPSVLSVPKKSKFDTDSDDENPKSPESPHTSVRRKSRFRDSDSPPVVSVVKQAVTEEKPTLKSRDEIMQEVMLKVRQTLTEVLLEVTTEEMQIIAQEVLYKARLKGLGIYGDSEDSDSGDSSPESRTSCKESTPDSDEELKNYIKIVSYAEVDDAKLIKSVQIMRKKQFFAKTEREIEAHLKIEEDRQMEQEKQHSVVKEDYTSHGEREAERQVEKQIDSKQAALYSGFRIDSKQDKKDSEENDYKRSAATALTNNNHPCSLGHEKSHDRIDSPKENNTLKISTDGSHSESSSSSEDESSSSESNNESEDNIKKSDHSDSESFVSASSHRNYDSSRNVSRNKKHMDKKRSKYKKRSRSRESQYKSPGRQSTMHNVKGEYRVNREDYIRKYYKRGKRSRSRSSSKSKSHHIRSRESDRKRHYSSSRSERYHSQSQSSKRDKESDYRRSRRKRSDSDTSSSKHYSSKRSRHSRSRSHSVREKSLRSRDSSSTSRSPYFPRRSSGKRSEHSHN